MIVSTLEFYDLKLKDAFVVKPFHFSDHRGDFYKLYNQELLQKKGVKPLFPESYVSISKKGVLRGLHYQVGKYPQAKLVGCIRGEVFDVLVDLRKNSPTFGKWAGVPISESNMLSVYVPRGFAHGTLALSDNTTILYYVDNHFSKEDERGISYNDPDLAIKWPNISKSPILSEKDETWPTFKDCEKFGQSL